jgi:hypothetical protein
MEGRWDDFERWRICILGLPTSQYLTAALVAAAVLLRAMNIPSAVTQFEC